MGDCRDCKHCGCDPDGLFCGHPESLNQSNGYGKALSVAKEDICTNDNPLFEIADEKILISRGRK